MEVGGSQLPTAKPSRGTLVPGRGLRGFAYGAVTLYGGAFQLTSAAAGGPPGLEAQPGTHQPLISPRSSRGELVWAAPLSVAPTQGIPYWFLFLPLLRCFRSGGSHSVLPRLTVVSRAPRALRPRQEVPFGDPGFDGCMRLPRAYRCLPRPSSAPEPSHPPGGICAAGPGTGPDPSRPPEPMRGAHCEAPLRPASALHPTAMRCRAA